MNLDYYNIFYYVAINENISLAAKKLHISQPSVSRYINLLENEMNTKLFFRSKQGVKLTSEGKILFAHVSKGLEHFRRAEAELNVLTNKDDEILNIAVSQLTIQTILPSIIEKYKLKYPSVKLKLNTYSSAQAIASLQANLVDLAIIPSPIDYNPMLKVIKLVSQNNILIAGQKYNFLQDKIIHLRELVNYPYIALSQGTAGRKYLNQLSLKHSVIFEPEIEVPSSDLIPPLVKHNLGLSIIAEIFALDELEKGTIIKLKLAEELPKRNFILCTNKFQLLNHACENFIDIAVHGT